MLDGRLLAVTVADDLAVRLLQLELEGRQFLARERWVRNIVHETRIATAAGWAPPSVASEAKPAAARNSRRCGSDMVLSLRSSEMLRRRRPCDHRRAGLLDHKVGVGGWGVSRRTSGQPDVSKVRPTPVRAVRGSIEWILNQQVRQTLGDGARERRRAAGFRFRGSESGLYRRARSACGYSDIST